MVSILAHTEARIAAITVAITVAIKVAIRVGTRGNIKMAFMAITTVETSIGINPPAMIIMAARRDWMTQSVANTPRYTGATSSLKEGLNTGFTRLGNIKTPSAGINRLTAAIPTPTTARMRARAIIITDSNCTARHIEIDEAQVA